MKIEIDSQVQLGRPFRGGFTLDEVKNEPMLFNCDLQYALEHGGPITRAFVEAFMDDQLALASHWLVAKHSRKEMLSRFVIDSRVHMLMKGWYPCIPGFHHDDVPRTALGGQPNYIRPHYRSKHCMGLVNGDVCPTQYAVGVAEFDLPEEGIIYKQWHLDVVEKIEHGELNTLSAPSNRLVYFDDRSWHQGTTAVKDGWRWFARISWNTDRADTITNELRRQVQAYLAAPMEGW